jgi:hypothetical protein
MHKTISPQFQTTNDFLENFSLEDFNNPQRTRDYINFFALDKACQSLDIDQEESTSHWTVKSVSGEESTPLPPHFDDLCRLHYVVLSRRVLNVLEFGSGWSTRIMAEAMQLLRKNFGEWGTENTRVETPFHIYSVEEDQRFASITRERLGKRLAPYATVQQSSVELILHDNRIATVFAKVPNISPDFIYLDGPSQYATSQELNGFSFRHKCRMPMAADILRLEFFLEPGTFILVDGRTANARFLKAYLKRNWAYLHDEKGDVHYFELQEPPLGKFNKIKMEFSLGSKFLL